jgi:hypothetical protein
MATSIAGNDGFTNIFNLAGQLSDLSVGEVSALNVKDLTAETTSVKLGSRVISGQVIGYAPTDFSTNAIGPAPLNNMEGLARATANTDTQLLLLPVGATITAVEMSNNGTTITSSGAPTFDLASGLFNTAGVNLLAAVALADANTLARAATAPAAIGSAGAPTGVVVVAANNFVTVDVNTAALTAGDMVVKISYVI